MDSNKKVKYLVVDTTGFITNLQFQEMAVNIVTTSSVTKEITSKRQLRRLVILPYDLVVKEPFAESIKHITEFSKKTGDYASLSATDIQVIALTYQLEKEHVGVSHLRSEPIKRVITPGSLPCQDFKDVAGFFLPKKGDEEVNGETVDSQNVELSLERLSVQSDGVKVESGNSDAKVEVNSFFENKVENTTRKVNDFYEDTNDIASLEKLSVQSDGVKVESVNSDAKVEVNSFVENKVENTTRKVDDFNEDSNDIANTSDNCDSGNNVEEEEEDDDDDDESGWITPGNIGQMKMKIISEVDEETKPVVGCITTDFAMQNVLKQMGLNVIALDGRVIKELRTFILRCYACYKTTGIMDKVFCPSCGNKTLKKVAVTTNPDGTQNIHINYRKPLTARGKRFSLPTPKGGKHANNPILCEDQPMPQQRVSRLTRTKNNPLDDDYIAGFSPFVTRDVYSRSAMLAIRPNAQAKQWMRRNPNESNKPGGRKRK